MMLSDKFVALCDGRIEYIGLANVYFPTETGEQWTVEVRDIGGLIPGVRTGKSLDLRKVFLFDDKTKDCIR